MLRWLLYLIPITLLGAPCGQVTISASHSNGQTFVQWTDLATGAGGAIYRYNLYRATSQITSIGGATLIQSALPNNSGLRVWGSYPQYSQTIRQSPSALSNPLVTGGAAPMVKLVDGGSNLADGSGLAVVKAPSATTQFYAVTAISTDASCTESTITVGANSLTSGISESVGSIEPIRQAPSTDTNQQPGIYGWGGGLPASGRPLVVWLHASGGQANSPMHGDAWQYWGDISMGYQDGVPGTFAVFQGAGVTPYSGTQTSALFKNDLLVLSAQDAMAKADFIGSYGFQTNWFGAYATGITGYPGTSGAISAAFPWTENRLAYQTAWTISHYSVDPNRVYASGHSMGGWGTASWATHRPDLFAAVFTDLPRWKISEAGGNRSLMIFASGGNQMSGNGVKMPDGVTDYNWYYDQIQRVNCATYQPPILWAIGRHDAFAAADINPEQWTTHEAMATALQACHLWAAFAWDNQNHALNATITQLKNEYLTPFAFRKNVSYPVPTGWSRDDSPGTVTDTTSGCINCGWSWSSPDGATAYAPTDTSTTWSAKLTNSIGAGTADISPRNTQSFLPAVGTSVNWSTNNAQSGTATVDAYGVVTATGVNIAAGGTIISFDLGGGGGGERSLITGRVESSGKVGN